MILRQMCCLWMGESRPHHKHYPEKVMESQPVELRQVLEEVIEMLVMS